MEIKEILESLGINAQNSGASIGGSIGFIQMVKQYRLILP